MQRLKRLWGQIKDSWRKSSTLVKLGIILLTAILIFLAGDYAGLGIFSWAGVRGKTLWDWLQLLIIPAVLAGAAWWLQRAERRAERQTSEERSKVGREIAGRRSQEATLQTYLDRMKHLLLRENLRGSKQDDGVRVVARARTLTTLRELDGERKGILLQFLHEAGLIHKDGPIINLSKVDLRGVNLHRAILSDIFLAEANLAKADLRGTYLIEADLRMADLNGADLRETGMHKTSLERADLSGADLSHAILIEVNLCGARLVGARFSGYHASTSPEFRTWLEDIIYDNQTEWPEGFLPPSNAIKKE
jgi:hypothetical protein